MQWSDLLKKLLQELQRSKFGRSFNRLNILAVIILLLNIVLVSKLFTVQVVRGGFYSALAADQHELLQKLVPKRGEILVREDGKTIPLVTNKAYQTLYAIPKEIAYPGWAAKLLSEVLGMDQLELEKRLNKPGDPYEPIKRKLTDEEINKVKELKQAGLGFIEEAGRFYPDKNLFSHVLGFVSVSSEKKKGQYGLEGRWDQSLAGRPGVLKAEKDVSGRWIAAGKRYLDEAEDGQSLVLTLDRTIQYFVCKKLEEYVKKFEATGGSVIIMDPETGKIISMCGYPNFDPNKYNEVADGSVYNNPAIFMDYEPGSTFKAITMAAGIDGGQIEADSTYIDEGFVKIGKYTIKNSDGKSHGLTDMTTVLEESLNTGAVHIAEKLGLDVFRKYLYDFGFGEPTGVDMDSEVKGNLNSLNKKGEIFLASSFGQGITATALQVVNAYAAIANGGRLLKPQIIDEVIHTNGESEKTQTQVIRQVVSNRAAKIVSGMLVSTIKEGHSKKAGVPGYLIAGKTGTAQIANTEGAGYSQDHIHSLVGFGPVDEPKFAMIVRVDKPNKDVMYAESTAAPLFGEIAKFILNYWKVPPTE